MYIRQEQTAFLAQREVEEMFSTNSYTLNEMFKTIRRILKSPSELYVLSVTISK
jgi:hypothetical protein